MPIASLPSSFGVGGFGKESYRFVDILSDAGFKLWQILPLNALGYGHSPYQPLSSYAIDEIYTDLSDLKRRGFLSEIPSYRNGSERIDYEAVRAYMAPLLLKAFESAIEKEKNNVLAFIYTHPWVKAWGLYSYYKKKNGLKEWSAWPKGERDRIEDISSLNDDERNGVLYEAWVQMNLYREWKSLRAHANRRGIKIIGDLPFYVGYDSADVWGNQEFFDIDMNSKKPISVAGVPPDYFSKDGQRWGNPIYKWDLLEKNGFSFWIDRIKGNQELYDIVRSDHFRAFDTYWKIDAKEKTAKNGEWVLAPGYKLFDTLKEEIKDIEIIAEDLGDLRPEVLALRDHYGFPGMEVIEFDFYDSEVTKKRDALSKENAVLYTGTHDNMPFKAFFSSLKEKEKKEWIAALENKGFIGDISKNIIEYCLSSVASYAIFPLSDLLNLGEEARLNEPGSSNQSNWSWSLRDYKDVLDKVPYWKEVNGKYNR